MNTRLPGVDGSQPQAWRLLAEFVVPGGAGSEARAAGLAVEAVRELDLPPAQQQLVRESVAGAAHKIQAGEAETPTLPLSVSVLISDSGNQAAAERRGWGCFVVKRQVGAAAHHKIELFLYSEGGGPGAETA